MQGPNWVFAGWIPQNQSHCSVPKRLILRRIVLGSSHAIKFVKTLTETRVFSKNGFKCTCYFTFKKSSIFATSTFNSNEGTGLRIIRRPHIGAGKGKIPVMSINIKTLTIAKVRKRREREREQEEEQTGIRFIDYNEPRKGECLYETLT